jgi:hypothetical protein
LEDEDARQLNHSLIAVPKIMRLFVVALIIALPAAAHATQAVHRQLDVRCVPTGNGGCNPDNFCCKGKCIDGFCEAGMSYNPFALIGVGC